jgi:hypothetical protein
MRSAPGINWVFEAVWFFRQLRARCSVDMLRFHVLVGRSGRVARVSVVSVTGIDGKDCEIMTGDLCIDQL